jgi:L-threonylcarbamoyladenylate synthase
MTIITKDIHKAILELNNGKAVAIPTETVYGLAANIYDENAINSIFNIKNRPSNNPLIVHIKSVNQLEKVAREIPPMAEKLAAHFWPGPLTLVLKKQNNISNLITSGKDTVAVRVPNHPVTIELLEKIDYPLAAPSANPFGSISPTNSEHVFHYFENKLGVILEGGKCRSGIESTIIGFENGLPILYRHGSISIEEIESVIGPIQIKNKDNINPDAPGMFSRHYAPQTKSLLSDNVLESVENCKFKNIGVLTFKNKIETEKEIVQYVLSPKGNYFEAAQNLYDYLHQLDKLHLDVLFIEKLPEVDLGKSINDRLSRAVTEL